MKKFLILFLFLIGIKDARSQSFKELNDSLIYYYQGKNFDRAIPFAEKLVVFVKENYGEENKVYPIYLNMLAGLYLQKGQLKKTEEVLIKANQVIQKVAGDKSEELIKGYTLLAIVYNGLGEDDKAIPFLIKAMEYYKKEKGETDSDYAASLNKLAKVYESLGLYNNAEPLFISAVEIRKNTNGPESLEYATTVNNLGLLYMNMGKPEKTEPLLLTALQIRKKVGGDNSEDYANSLNNVAVFYAALGQNEKAENYYINAAAIYKSISGATSPAYITCLTNIGELYSSMFRYQEAEKVLLEALAIVKENLKENQAANGNITRNLGQLYLSKEEFAKAEPLLLQFLSMEEEKSNSTLTYAGALNDVGYLYSLTNRLSEAASFYKKAAEVIKNNFGNKHVDYSSAISNVAELYRKQGRFAEAVSVMSQVNAIKIYNLQNLFSILSEAEKLTYIESNFFVLQNNLALLAAYPDAPSAFYRENFDLLLLIKSFLLTDSKNVLEYVRNSKDSSVNNIYNHWLTNKAILAKEYSLPQELRRKEITAIEQETENLEKNLTRISSEFRSLQTGIQIRTSDIYQKLKEDEAAIEFVRFPNIKNEGTIEYSYAAMVLTKNDSIPKFVQLCNEAQLQQLFDSAGRSSTTRIKNFYRGLDLGNTSITSLGNRLYNLIWAPIEPYLNGIKNIAYSPAEKLYSISFQALPTDSNTLLIDKYNLQQYTSIRQLALNDTTSQKVKPTDIVLFGNADFSMDSISIVKQRNAKIDTTTVSTTMYAPQQNEMSGAWSNLPGTADEGEKIAALFKKNGKTNKFFKQENASERNLKVFSTNSPQVLHIATHGFFLQQKNTNASPSGRENVYTLADNPLLRSGIILAGGNYVWGGKAPIDGTEDGIVTAYEIAQLNLSKTELVVLSACETGLGDVKGNEGVFGLQRAFKMAGVKKMIVSLWQVPDKETAELMKTFYDYWLKGKTINEALIQAQADMRKKYLPFYWAAFVLIE
ncbi:MAG: CHAT domain-containing protein [Chitinophagaceae bacterium]|nr:CHAT domain-containing protein [Chitinophagaceae bacterium]